mgnify:CR=1 FL=1
MSISTTTSSNKEREEHKVCEDYSMFKNHQLGKGGFGQLYLGKNLKCVFYSAVHSDDLIKSKSPTPRILFTQMHPIFINHVFILLTSHS